MTQKTFSEFIGKSQGTISSIFTGRTRATLDIIEAIKQKFPQVSTEWLIFGTGEMYAQDSSEGTAPANGSTSTPSEPLLNFEVAEAEKSNSESSKKTLQTTQNELVKILDKPARKIKEIRVFYDDQTWETFVPQKN